MKKTITKIIFPAICGAYILFAATFVFFTGTRENRPAENAALSTVPATAPTQKASEEVYVVREIDGRVAVESVSTGKIVRRTDTMVSILPDEDRKRLKNGIKADSARELRRLLEDFCS